MALCAIHVRESGAGARESGRAAPVQPRPRREVDLERARQPALGHTHAVRSARRAAVPPGHVGRRTCAWRSASRAFSRAHVGSNRQHTADNGSCPTDSNRQRRSVLLSGSVRCQVFIGDLSLSVGQQDRTDPVQRAAADLDGGVDVPGSVRRAEHQDGVAPLRPCRPGGRYVFVLVF